MLPFDTHFAYAAAVAFVLAFGAIFAAFALLRDRAIRAAFAQGLGPHDAAKLGWIVMEAPSPIGFAIVFFLYRPAGIVPWVLFGLWELPLRLPNVHLSTSNARKWEAQACAYGGVRVFVQLRERTDERLRRDCSWRTPNRRLVEKPDLHRGACGVLFRLVDQPPRRCGATEPS